jgi:GR25 family glycosyltransferase involved in LPS biosynthesis
VKYTIIHVNDRAKENMDYNRSVLKDLDYVDDIDFFNGNTRNAWDVLNHRKIRTDVWNPYDGRSFPPLPGEYGIWVSTINVWDYIINNDISSMLVLEDDVKLIGSAQENLKVFLSELPDNWDFLSLYYFEGQNGFDEGTGIGSGYIHKSINQPAAGQATIYSKSGAKKLRKLVQRKGIEYTSDCFIFEQAKLGYVDGYSIIPNKKSFLVHENFKIKSIIDENDVRKTGL